MTTTIAEVGMPVQGAARGRHIRSRLERLNRRIARIVEYQTGQAQPTDTGLAVMYPTFRAARAALKAIPRQVRVDFNTAERERMAKDREDKQRKEKARLQSDAPAQQHAARNARKEERKQQRRKEA